MYDVRRCRGIGLFQRHWFIKSMFQTSSTLLRLKAYALLLLILHPTQWNGWPITDEAQSFERQHRLSSIFHLLSFNGIPSPMICLDNWILDTCLRTKMNLDSPCEVTSKIKTNVQRLGNPIKHVYSVHVDVYGWHQLHGEESFLRSPIS